MIKYIIKRNLRLQNLVVSEVNHCINEILVALICIPVCNSRKYEFYYEVCSNFNELVNLKSWTSSPDIVIKFLKGRSVSEKIKDRSDVYFYLVYDKTGIKVSEETRKELFSKVLKIYDFLIFVYNKYFTLKRYSYIYPDDFNELIEKLFEKYFP